MSEPVIPIAQVDAFTDRPFSGNPAAVCMLPEMREDSWLQEVAAEMNLSETAFLVPQEVADGGAVYRLRWFTPTAEVELCGHATLASAHLLWEAGYAPPGGPVRFETAGGALTCERPSGGGEGEAAVEAQGWAWMDFPATPASLVDPVDGGALSGELRRALGAEPGALGRSRFDLLVELGSEEEVRSLRPDFRALSRLDARGTIVTARASAVRAGDGGDGYDFVSRYFAPHVGIDEDPVTGSAHCALAPWWAERLGRHELTGYQASRRGGTVRTRLEGDRVHLGGRAVTVFTGELLV